MRIYASYGWVTKADNTQKPYGLMLSRTQDVQQHTRNQRAEKKIIFWQPQNCVYVASRRRSAAKHWGEGNEFSLSAACAYVYVQARPKRVRAERIANPFTQHSKTAQKKSK